MTVGLMTGSPRLVHAQRFGAELRKAMQVRKIGAPTLSKASGATTSGIGLWRAGANLPRLDTALRLAECLDWPQLGAIVRTARSQPCVRCRLPFVNEGGGPKRFCSPGCRLIDEQLRRPTAGVELAMVVRSELERPRISRRDLAAALTRYNQSESKRRLRIDGQDQVIGSMREAVAAMCAGCEPEGTCRTPECALRPISPLPLRDGRQQVATARPAEGAHGPTHRAAWLVAQRAANARRWSRPGERERLAESSRAAWADPEQRASRSAAISLGRRRSA